MTGLGTLQLATVVLLEFPEEALGKHQWDNCGVKDLDCLAHKIHTLATLRATERRLRIFEEAVKTASFFYSYQ